MATTPVPQITGTISPNSTPPPPPPGYDGGDPYPLGAQNRQRLDGIVQQMIANKEPDANISAVVKDFKQKYSPGPPPAVDQTPTSNPLVDALTGGQPIPDAAAQARASALGRANTEIDNAGDMLAPVHPYGGAPLVTTNPAQMAARYPAAGVLLKPAIGAVQMSDGGAQIANAHTARDVAGGAHRVISGGFDVLSPMLAPALIAAPVATVGGLVAGMAAQKAATEGLKAAGVPEEYSDLAGDVAGFAGGVAGGRYAPAAADALADTITNARNKAAEGLKESANQNYETALNPTTRINKALTQDQIAPGLRERGVTATSLKGLQEQAQSHIEDLGSQIDEAFERHADAGTRVSAQPILDRLEQEKQSYIVDGVPINEAYVNRVEGLQNQVQNVAHANGGEIPLASLRRIRQIHDKTIAHSKGGFALAPDDASAVDALKTYTDAIRSTVADTDPQLAALNKEFSFWKNVDKVAGESLLRKTGQRAPLTQKFGELLGGTLGGHVAGYGGGMVGAKIGGSLGKLKNSALWNTHVALLKSRLADLLDAGDIAGARKLIEEDAVSTSPAPATAGLAKSGESVPASSDAGRRGNPSDLRNPEEGESGGVPDASGSDQPLGPHPASGGAGADGGVKRSGAQIEAERLMAEAKQRTAERQAESGSPQAASDNESAKGRMMKPFPDIPFDQENATPEEVLRDSRILYRPGKGGHKGIVYLNPQARELLTYVGEAAEEDDFGGYWMNARKARGVIKELDRTIAQNFFGLRAVKPLFQIRQALRKALKDNGSVMVVEAGPGRTLGEVRSTIYHEAHHASETDLSPEQAQAFMADPLAHKAGRTLVGDDPENPRYPDNPVELASEIGAHLQEDPTGRVLDLTPEQAEVLWRRYVRHYPGQFQFDRMRPTLRKAAHEELSGTSSSEK